MKTGLKLILGGVIAASATGYLAYSGAVESWQYYLTADECLAGGTEFVGQRLRVSGKIAADSLGSRDDRTAEFALAGASGQILVTCPLPLPDNLTENKEVVVEGTLIEEGYVRAERVLTRCASKYQAQ